MHYYMHITNTLICDKYEIEWSVVEFYRPAYRTFQHWQTMLKVLLYLIHNDFLVNVKQKSH